MEQQKKTNKKLDVETSLKLIEAVKKRTLIWNRRSQHHRNKNRLHHAWLGIASEVGLSVKEAIIRWRKLLCAFRVYKAKVKKSIQTGSGNDEVYEPHWFAYTAMLFLSEGTNAVQTSDTIRVNAVVCKSIDELTSKSPIPAKSACPEPQTKKMKLPRKTNKKLNVDASLKLIEAVKKRPIIWNNGFKYFLKNKTKFAHIWVPIAAEVDLSVKDAKILWKQLLASFRVYKAKVRKSLQTGAVYEPVWFAYNAMLFLLESKNAVRTSDAVPYDTVVCKSSDELAAGPPETSPPTCPKPGTQVKNALQIDPRSQPCISDPVRPLPAQQEDPLQIKQEPVEAPANTCLNCRCLRVSPSLLDTFVNLIEHELNELPTDLATMAQAEIYMIIAKYKLKDVHQRST